MIGRAAKPRAEAERLHASARLRAGIDVPELPRNATLLRKSGDSQASPVPRDTCPTASVTGSSAGRLPERHAKQNYHHQTGWGRGVAESGLHPKPICTTEPVGAIPRLVFDFGYLEDSVRSTVAIPRSTTMTVRVSGALSEFVATNVGEDGAYENVSEYIRDLERFPSVVDREGIPRMAKV